MKIAKEIKVKNRVRTVIECSSCGATTYVNTGKDTKTAKTAMERSCKICSPPQNLPNVEGWWKQTYASQLDNCIPQAAWTKQQYLNSNPDDWLWDMNNIRGYGHHPDY